MPKVTQLRFGGARIKAQKAEFQIQCPLSLHYIDLSDSKNVVCIRITLTLFKVQILELLPSKFRRDGLESSGICILISSLAWLLYIWLIDHSSRKTYKEMCSFTYFIG